MAIRSIGDLSSGAPSGVAVAVIADGSALRFVSRAIYVGGAGNVVAVMEDGAIVTFPSVPAGSFLPIRATAINTSTATSMVALF